MDLFLANANGLTKQLKVRISGRMEPWFRGAIVVLDRKRPTHSDTVSTSGRASGKAGIEAEAEAKLEFLDHVQHQLPVECCSGARFGLAPPPDGDRTRLGVRWRSETPDTGKCMKSGRVESAGRARTNA